MTAFLAAALILASMALGVAAPADAATPVPVSPTHTLTSATPVRGQPTVSATTVSGQPTISATRSISLGDQPGASATPVVHATAHPPKPTATPATANEAQTPLHLSDPLGSDAAAPATPWWVTLLDITWKLGLVLGLIYGAMRALAALKRKGFTPKTLAPTGGKGQRHFFEQLDEIQLAPQHALHAVRAGERVYLIARTNGEMRAIGEMDLGELGAEMASQAALPSGFAQQLLRAWTQLHPAREAAALPASLAGAPATGDDEAATAAVIDAQWVKIKPEPAPPSAPTANVTELPVQRGSARPGDAPAEPLSPSEEREILWYAEEHGDSAAAKRFGLTRQRVTAMRNRYDRQRRAEGKEPDAPLATAHQTSSATKDAPSKANAGKGSAKPTAPQAVPPLADVAHLTHADHPRATAASLAAARGSLARTAYAGAASATPTTAVPAVDVARSAEQPTADVGDPPITVGQILAARFGIKLPPTAQ